MGKYTWFTIINLLIWGYLVLLLVDGFRQLILWVKKHRWNVKLMTKEFIRFFKSTYGRGTLSVIILILALVWMVYCDELLGLLNIPSWSNGGSGNHIGICYSLIFLIPAYILSYTYRKDFAANLVMKLSGILSFSFIAFTLVFTFYQ